ncbi:MAG: helix-turn-helix domain-containing protein [Lachnospiraceae bacterium]|nr:helix-turn-helix domain-containing protein [Lachnospiraceae bacterium]
MTLGEKIYRLRSEQGMSQEAFGEALGVSRQSVSKWETDQSLPELDKIVAISEIFAVSTDYLLKETAKKREGQGTYLDASYTDEKLFDKENVYTEETRVIIQKPSFHYEYKSKKTFMGLPLVHINFGLKPVRAKGIIAIGNAAQGIIAIGIAGVGVITLAPVGVGLLLAIGCIVVGGVALGSLAVGVIAMGAVCCGIFTMGAVAIGQFSYGAFALGSQIAVGDVAHGNIALGYSEATGNIYEEVRAADGSFDYQAVIAAIDANVPAYWHIFTNWMKAIIRMMVTSGRIMP